MRIFLLGLLSVAFGHALATELDDFHKRFDFVRGEDNVLIEVRDLSMAKDISPKAFLKGWKRQIESRRYALRSMSLDEDVDLMFEDFHEDEGEGIQNGIARSGDDRLGLKFFRSQVRMALQAASSENMAKAFEDRSFQKVVRAFSRDVKKSFVLLRSNILAKPKDSSFFYKRTVSHEVVRRALELAERLIPDTAVFTWSKLLFLNTKRWPELAATFIKICFSITWKIFRPKNSA